MATRKFSPAQLAAQKLFAERARAGTLGQRKKRKPNPGLYENIDAKRKRIAAGSGEKMRKPGQAGRPTAKAFEQSAMTAKRNPVLPRGFVIADDYTREIFNPYGAKPYDAIFMRTTKEPGFSPYDLTILKSNSGEFIAATGSKVYQEKFTTAAAAANWLANWYKENKQKMYRGVKTNPDKAKPRAYVMRASQATGRPPVKGTKAGNRLITRRKKALSAPAGYFPNPSTNRGLAIFLDAIALGETFSESKLIEALDHPSLSVSDRNVIRDALKGLPYSHIRLQDAAMKIRNYKGERKTNPAAAMMTGYQVICMHPRKHVVGIFKTMAEAKMVATAMANAKGVAYGVKAVKVHKTHFAV